MAQRIQRYTIQLVKEQGYTYDFLENAKSFTKPSRILDFCKDKLNMENLTNEHFVIITMDTKLKPIGVHTLHIGLIDQAIIDPKVIMQHVLLTNAKSIFMVHNHPSGDPEPSQADINVTRRIAKLLNLFDVTVQDHLIIGRDCATSIRQDYEFVFENLND